MPNNLDMGGFGSPGIAARTSALGKLSVDAGNPASSAPLSVGTLSGEHFSVSRDGKINVGASPEVTVAVALQYQTGDGSYIARIGKQEYFQFSLDTSPTSFGGWGVSTGNGVNIAMRGSAIGFDASNGLGDLFLRRHAANVLIQRNGTDAQQAILSRSWTDNSNYSWFRSTWNTSTLMMMAEGAGTGSDGSVAFNDAVLSTSATVGFVMLPSCAGTPSGTPADIPTGQCPAVIDSSANRIWIYVGGAWKYAPLT